jgi:hypothetical protein
MKRERVPDELTEREAGLYLDRQVDFLRAEVNAGRLKCIGTRAARRFLVKDLERWKRETSRAKRAKPRVPDFRGVPRNERYGRRRC